MKATYIQPLTERMQLRAMSVMVGISGGGLDFAPDGTESTGPQ